MKRWSRVGGGRTGSIWEEDMVERWVCVGNGEHDGAMTPVWLWDGENEESEEFVRPQSCFLSVALLLSLLLSTAFCCCVHLSDRMKRGK